MTNENHTTQPLDRRDDPRLTAYVLGELSPEERATLERELESDPELAAEVRAIENLAGDLRGSFELSDVPALDESRRDRILQATRPTPMPFSRPRRITPRIAAIAAAVFAALGIGVWGLARGVHDRAEGPFVYPFVDSEQVAALPEASDVGSYAAIDSGKAKTGAKLGFYEGFVPEEAEEASTSLEIPKPSLKTFTFGTTSGAFQSMSMDVRETTDLNGFRGGTDNPSYDGLGYGSSDDDSEAVSASDLRHLQALGYGGEELTSNPNVSANGAALTPPLSPGAEVFQGGTTGPFTLTKDSLAETHTWRDTQDGPGLRNLLAPGETPGTEAYDRIPASPFRDPKREPLSTFSIDVDTASYANVRRFLSERQLPPPDAVRIEELVNYFRYDYPEPRGKVPFSVTVDSASVPWQPEHRLVRIGLRGRAPADERPKVKNLVFLVDVSGSMDSPDKLPLVQRSLRLLVDELSPEDRVALVVYAGNSGVVLPSTSVDSRTTIVDAIERLSAGGSTNGGSGIQLAYEMARKHFAKEGVNRVILATDGDFNVGITDRAALLRLIEEERRSGVFLSVLGFGTGNLKDGTMEQLADHGNGNYGYIDSLAEARKLLVREMDATLETIAKDVKIQVEFNPAKVAAYRLVGYENRVLAARDFNDDKKDAGEIGAGHTVTALYEIVPVGVAIAASVDPLRYQPTAPRDAAQPSDATGELLTVKLRYKEPAADKSQLLAVPFTDDGRSFDEAGPELRFAASVAAFGLCLRRSEAAGTTTLRDVYRWAEPAIGADPHGDRREFLKLVDLAAGLSRR